MKNSNWFFLLKLCAAVFNGMATFSVFLEIFQTGQRGAFFALMSAVLSVILVDLFFIVALITLEDKEVAIRERLVWAVSAALLAIAVLGIGIADEGLLGIVPRTGFVLLVFQSILAVVAEYQLQYNSRAAKEQRIRDDQVILRAKEKAAAYERMIKSPEMRDNFQEKERQREMENLNLDQKQSTPYSEPIIQPSLESYAEEVEDGIMQLPSGGYGWISPKTGELTTITALGKAYSLPGARNALRRASHNGHK